MVSETMLWFLTGVAQLLTSIVATFTILSVTDKFIGGRLKDVLQRWLGIGQLQTSANRHDNKLDALHNDHRTTIGIQHDLATAHNNLAAALIEENVVRSDGGHDIFVDKLLIEEHAQEAGAEWPGSFLRGGGSDWDEYYPHYEEGE